MTIPRLPPTADVSPMLVGKDPVKLAGKFDATTFQQAMDAITQGLSMENAEHIVEWHVGGALSRPNKEGAIRVLDESIASLRGTLREIEQALQKVTRLKTAVSAYSASADRGDAVALANPAAYAEDEARQRGENERDARALNEAYKIAKARVADLQRTIADLWARGNRGGSDLPGHVGAMREVAEDVSRLAASIR